MFGTTKHHPSEGPASDFGVPTELRGSQPDIWTEAGRAIELAYRQPAPMDRAVRVAVAVAIAVAAALITVAKHYSGGVLG
jgi:hypothetical protein